jgi:hypothetical protein
VRADQETRIDNAARLRRLAVLLLLSIPAATATILTEALFVGHIVFLVQALGFALGLAVFVAIWAALGLTAMAVSDLVWPRIVPFLAPLAEAFTGSSTVSQGLIGAKGLLCLAVLGVCAVLVGAGVAMAFAGSEIKDWAVEHTADAEMLLIVSVVIFAILIVIARLSRGLVDWVRSIADTAGPVSRSFGALVVMGAVGPVLGWPLFRLLGYSRRTTYALTLAAAAVFGGIWVPFYSLGVWSVVEGLF